MKIDKRINSLPKETFYDEINSPVGKLIIITTAKGLHAILWDVICNGLLYQKISHDFLLDKNEPTIVQTKQQLTEYFQGERKKFSLPLVLDGSVFQLSTWKQLLNIPYACTISYAEQARQVGNKNKARAVGLANGANLIPIIIPCHRVIGSNGRLVGFGGGLDKKAYLLALEKTYQ